MQQPGWTVGKQDSHGFFGFDPADLRGHLEASG
jgi:hypothetical protein